MPVLIAAVVLVGALCALDLALTLGVIKRLHEHTELLASTRRPAGGIDVGSEISEFETSTVDGEHLLPGLLPEQTLVAFFSPGCEPCRDKLPKFVEYARHYPGGRTGVLTVVIGDPAQSAGFVSALGPVARVVVEEHDGPLSAAFKAQSYPTVLRVERDGDGRLVVADNRVQLDRPTAVTA
ncbi:TlpA family protein disulfide reductase [Streptomyces sp. NPDC058239]|uniref:TlpA family protein disulfide reductase n=1 Tax=unclassified Streptomyces TaxID=2593676 RepID=UPI003649F36F